MNLDNIAMGRCEKLLLMAKEMYDEDKALSKRYVSLARKIAMRHRLPLGSKSFCKKCGSIFIPGKTLKVRVASSKKGVIYECLKCNATKIYPYAKEKAKRKEKTKLQG
ncbi:MAG: ribonuclease P [Candidatus Micrarchaeota archaeon]